MVSASINDPIEMVNHPTHYNREGAMECIDEMLMIFGREATMHFCLLNAWKYRYRAGNKWDGAEDCRKSDWYIKKYKELLDEKTERFKMDLDAAANHPITVNYKDCGYAMNSDLVGRISLNGSCTGQKTND